MGEIKMKFTTEDLMKAMGLQVGDRIKVTFKDDTIEEYEIIKYDNGNIVLHDDFHGYDDHVGYLLDNEFEILPRPKRVGDNVCNLKCKDCPLRSLNYCAVESLEGLSFFNILEIWNNEEWCFDQEIYDLLKSRLNCEVE